MLNTPRLLRILGLALISLMLIGLAASPANAQSDKYSKGLPGLGQTTPAAPVTVSVVLSDTTIGPGGQVVLAITLDHKPGWHAHTNDPQLPESWNESGLVVVPTTITVTGPQGAAIGTIQWPESHTIKLDLTGSGTPEPYAVFEGKATAFVPVRFADDATGTIKLAVEVGYQACDDTTCDRPRNEPFTVEIAIDPAAPTDPTLTAALFAGFDPDGPADPQPTRSGPQTDSPADADTSDTTPTGQTFFGIPMPTGGLGGLIVLGFFGAIGGLVLNLTPCVLPVIPIKVLTLSKHAGESRMRAVVLGLWMALGVVAFWASLSIPVLTLQGFTDPSRIFGIWWLTTGIGVVIAIMSLGLMGMFQINLPQKAYMVNPKADSPWGSFVFGIMTAILGLPCFGFVAGALVPAAITQGTGFVIVLFTSMGVGMAAPYLVLAAFPQFLEKLPRTGPASELVKQMMGLLLLAAAAYFMGSGLIALVASQPYLAKLLHIWVAALLGVASGLWLIFQTFKITKSLGKRGVFSFLAIFVAGLSLYIAITFTADAREDYEFRQAAMADAAEDGTLLKTVWNNFSPALMERALAEGHIVIQNFTAEWCLNCKVLEKTVLARDSVKSLLQAEDTVMIEVDLTGSNAAGEQALEDLGRTGIPTLVIYGPGLDEPWISSAYTVGQVVETIKRARKGRETAGQ